MDDQERGRRVAELFDAVADDYDQSGVDFFGPIARGLVDALELTPGERVVDVGCGRGAVTFLAADAVGRDGTVTALDIAPAMVQHTATQADALGYPQVRALSIAPDDLGLPDGCADVVASSLVLFFSPQPAATLRTWLRVLAPGGRIGLSTFGPADPTWKQVDALFHPYLPPQLLDARTTGEAGPFASDERMEELCRSCGATEVRTVRAELPVRFRDAAQWRAFSMGTGQRLFWGFVPEDRREAVYREAAEVLESARDAAGDIVLTQGLRYTLATV